MNRLLNFWHNPYKGQVLVHRILRRIEDRILLARMAALGGTPLERLISTGGNVANHFRHRGSPRFFFEKSRLKGILHDISSEEALLIRSRAAEFLDLTFAFRNQPPVRFEKGIDWNHVAGGDPDWNSDLHRLDWLLTLLLARHLSEEEAFADRAFSCFHRWEEANPPGSPPWKDPFEVAQRANTLCWFLFLGMETPSMPDETIRSAAKTLLLSGHWIEATLEYHIPNNHLLIEAARLAEIGILFPEFPHSHHWLIKGTELLRREIKRQLSSDGVHREHSSFYQRMTTEVLLEILTLARRNAIPLASLVADRVRLMLTFLRGITRPDGEIPLIGDGFRSDILLRYDLPEAGAELIGASADARPPNAMTHLLMDSLPMDSLLMAKTAFSPSPSSLTIWEDGGYAVFRGPGKGGANFLLFNFTDFGMPGAPGHGHADCLSVEISHGGKPILIDPGAFSWRRDPQWRNAFRGTLAHNTLRVDGQDQTPLIGTFGAGHFARPTLRAHAISSSIICVDASHNGYSRLDSPVTHRRIVIAAGGDAWLIADIAEGTGIHDWEVAWHFDPGIKVHLEPDGALARNVEDGRGIWLLSAWATPFEPELHRGSQAPFLGWTSYESGKLDEAPVLLLKARSEAPAWMITALTSFEAQSERPILEASSGPDGVEVFLTAKETQTTVLVPWSGKQGGIFTSWKTDGSLAVVLEGADPATLIIQGSVVHRTGSEHRLNRL